MGEKTLPTKVISIDSKGFPRSFLLLCKVGRLNVPAYVFLSKNFPHFLLSFQLKSLDRRKTVRLHCSPEKRRGREEEGQENC